MQEIQVLGITLQDYSVREAMKRVDEFYNDVSVNAIGLITSRGILEAGATPEVEEWMKSLDLAVLHDVDVLKAAGNTNASRVKEVREDAFLKEFFRKLVKKKKNVFLLADSKAQLGQLTEIVTGYQERIRVVGTFALEELNADDDYLINEINIASPDVVISLLSSPRREIFYKDNHMKIQACIWLMLKEGVEIGSAKVSIWHRVSGFLNRRFFHRQVRKAKKES